MKGKLKWFNQEKGYGFIEGEDGEDYFLYRSEVPTDTELVDEQELTFEEKETDRGKQATNIQI